ncbi:MAG: site-specific integrase, partial [Treponema sp.]|nr:site-specific integrase [Treponema sp.]
MNAYPFSIFKRADRSCYSVSFKDSNGKYMRPVSTGKKTETEAVQAAFLMLREGTKLNDTTVSTQGIFLKDTIRNIKTETDS